MGTKRNYNYSTMTEEQAKSLVIVNINQIHHMTSKFPLCQNRAVVVKYDGILSSNTDQCDIHVVVCDKYEDGTIEYGNVHQTLNSYSTWKETLQFIEMYVTTVESLVA